MFSDDPDAAESRIADWQSMLDARARRAADIAIQLEGQRFAARAGGGMVIAIVNQAGHLIDLRLHPRVRDWPVHRIAKSIVDATDAARTVMTKRVRELVSEAGLTDA